MSERQRLILLHWFDGLVSVGMAVLAVFGLFRLAGVLGLRASVVDLFGTWPTTYVAAAAGVFAIATALVRPRVWVGAWRGLRKTGRHFGLVLKVSVGTSVALLFLLGPFSDAWILVVTVASPVACAALVTVLAYSLSRYVQKVRFNRGAPTPRVIDDETDSKDTGQDAWLLDDKPIETESENRFDEYGRVVDTLVQRLFDNTNNTKARFPNVALRGAFGSGKTSICNLVKDRYIKDPDGVCPEGVVFCRFEAWPYTEPDAMRRGLIETICDAVLEQVDEPVLWRIPEDYLRAMEGQRGGCWSWIACACRREVDAQKILDKLGTVLIRLNMRVVLFVDDLDRIEADSAETHQALVRSLNMIQNVPNMQYVVSLGLPTRAATDVTVMTDVSKLTRYDVSVPDVPLLEAVERLDELARSACSDDTLCYPWAWSPEAQKNDPQWWRSRSELLPEILPVQLTALLGLLSTPRSLKRALRHTKALWEGGLDGEINWYDLVLLSAVRESEPKLYEWIARRPGDFTEFSRHITAEERTKNKQTLHDMFENTVSGESSERHKAVKDIMAYLFPEFIQLVFGGSRLHRHDWTQGLPVCSCHTYGYSTYLKRALAGRVAEGEDDRPTLSFIRRVILEGLDENEVRDKYLGSLEQITSPHYSRTWSVSA